jgi:carbonic anhydrase
LVFDQSLGHIFVTRVAGNVVTPEIIASLEYGALVLGTKVILVIGHGNCGAVKATIQGKEVPGQISALFQHIQPAVDLAGPNLEAATKANAKIQAALLRQASTVISGLLKEGKLKVLAAYYDVASGAVALLEQRTPIHSNAGSVRFLNCCIRFGMRDQPVTIRFFIANRTRSAVLFSLSSPMI